MSEQKDSVEIGAAWKKESAKGTKYISGKLNNGKFIAIFANTRKAEGTSQPDYRIVMDIDSAAEMALLDEYSQNKLDEKKQAAVDRANRDSGDNIDLSRVFPGEE